MVSQRHGSGVPSNEAGKDGKAMNIAEMDIYTSQQVDACSSWFRAMYVTHFQTVEALCLSQVLYEVDVTDSCAQKVFEGVQSQKLMPWQIGGTTCLMMENMANAVS